MSEARGKRVLVISPAGEVHDHDNVCWYSDQTKSQVTQNYFNIGDMVVYDSTLKLLAFSTVRELPIDRIDAARIEDAQTYDFIIVRASNFIHNDMDWMKALDVLDQVQLPVFAVGVGAQAHGGGRYKLEGSNLRFWKTVSERSRVIGVRGTFTADVLAASGIRNVEIVGCPSMFRTRRRDLRIAPPDKVEKVAFSIRREADGTYAADVARYRAVQRDLLLQFARRFDVRVTIHGEPEEKAFFFKNPALMEKARRVFAHEGWFTPDTAEEMDRLYREKLFFFLKVADYDAFIRTQDLAVGYRVHGVLPALSNGVPGILVKYDSRSAELADTHAIPSVEPSEPGGMDVERMVAEADFAEFNRIYPLRYDKMRSVLEQNGLAHQMAYREADRNIGKQS